MITLITKNHTLELIKITFLKKRLLTGTKMMIYYY